MSVIPVRIDANVFNDAYLPHLENMARTQILYGGSSSGKSVFLAQRCVIDILGGGRNYLVCRAIQRYLRISVFNEIEKVIRAWELEGQFKINKTGMTITCSNGYQIIFVGLDDEQKLKSVTPAKGMITDIWVEEATETNKNMLKQLNKRLRGIEVGKDAKPKRLTLSFNPILKTHPIYEIYFSPTKWADDQAEYNDGELSILKTTHLDNAFLSEKDRKDLEDETDPYYFQVYTLGNWGVLGSAIFRNWKVKDLSEEIETYDNIFNGLDFGFSNDPAAAVRLHYNKKKKEIYIFGEMWELGLTNDILAAELKPIIEQEYITCDSAEPKSIAELNNLGINAHGAIKGKDSVNFGIQWLQQHKIIIDSNCIKTKHEFEVYRYKEDKHGNAMRIPVDSDNHIIDALRYALEDEMRAYTVEVQENPFYE